MADNANSANDSSGASQQPYGGYQGTSPYGGYTPGQQQPGIDPNGSGYPSPPTQAPYAGAPHQGGYQATPMGAGYPMQAEQGRQAANLSLIFGILAIVGIASIVTGPLAIWQANKARTFGTEATAGRVLGWIATILWILGIIAMIFFLAISMTAQSGTDTGVSTLGNLSKAAALL